MIVVVNVVVDHSASEPMSLSTLWVKEGGAVVVFEGGYSRGIYFFIPLGNTAGGHQVSLVVRQAQ